MALNELTVAEKLKQLYNLQLIDSEIDEISILKGELPMEVSDLEDEIAGLETRKGRLQNNIETMEADLAKHKTNIKEAESLISKYEKQMDNVKNNREYDALSKELEMQRLEIQLSEKRGREGGAQFTAKKETLKNTEIRLKSKQGALAEKKVELEKIIAKTEKEEEKDIVYVLKAADTIIEARLSKEENKLFDKAKDEALAPWIQNDAWRRIKRDKTKKEETVPLRFLLRWNQTAVHQMDIKPTHE